MGKNLFCILVAWLLCFSSRAVEPVLPAVRVPELDALFAGTNGWIGADGAYSTPLSTNTTVWLFSDTFVGQVRDGKRTGARMINNSIALQKIGREPEFYYPTNHAGEPESFIKPADHFGYFWLSDGTRTPQGLFVFLHQMKKLNDSTFGFQSVSTWLGKVENPDAAPAQWKVTQRKIPFTKYSPATNLNFGAAVLQDKEFIYIYGNKAGSNRAQHGMLVARAPVGKLDNFKAWRFYAEGAWKKNFLEATAVFSDAPSEASVSWQPTLKKFITIYSQYVHGKIVMRTAATPVGPWSEAIEIYQCPEMKWSDNILCYAAKGHPELSAPDELIITYASNSRKFAEVVNNAQLYQPRFIRLKFAER